MDIHKHNTDYIQMIFDLVKKHQAKLNISS